MKFELRRKIKGPKSYLQYKGKNKTKALATTLIQNEGNTLSKQGLEYIPLG
jgi:hypothetical protein